MGLKAKIIVTATVIAALVMVAWAARDVYLFFAGPALENAKQQIPFDSAKWRANSEDSGLMWPTRLRMSDSLVESKLLMGTTKAQVVTLLGPPDGGSYFPDWDLVYHLGPERGTFRIDSEWLLIRLKNKTVKEVALATD